jgi:hypothetical protein
MLGTTQYLKMPSQYLLEMLEALWICGIHGYRSRLTVLGNKKKRTGSKLTI